MKRERALADFKYDLKRKYGITIEDYERMLEEQHGVCAICHQTSKRRLVVDHNHDTGQVRALLCYSCNVAIGLLGDSYDRCLSAGYYLIDHAVKADVELMPERSQEDEDAFSAPPRLMAVR